MVQHISMNKKCDQGQGNCGKDKILTFQEKIVALIGNKTKISLEMNPRQRELES